MGDQDLFSFDRITDHAAGWSKPTVSRGSLPDRCARGLGGRIALVKRLYAGGSLAPAPRCCGAAGAARFRRGRFLIDWETGQVVLDAEAYRILNMSKSCYDHSDRADREYSTTFEIA